MAENMANEFMKQILPNLEDMDATESEINKTRHYYKMLAQAFLDAIPIYAQGQQGDIDYRERAVQGMANAVYGYLKRRYFPRLPTTVNDESMAKTFYALLARGFLEGINASTPEASDMANRVCGYIKAEYCPDPEVGEDDGYDDTETRDYHTMLAKAYLEGIST
jgi:hypothetical protein